MIDDTRTIEMGQGTSTEVHPVCKLAVAEDNSPMKFRTSERRSTAETRLSFTGDEESEKAFNDSYAIDSLLGHGISNVYEVHHRETWNRYACKEVRLDSHLNIVAALQSELAALRMTNHPNIMKLIEAYQCTEKAYLVLELVPGGDLISSLAQLPDHTERVIARLFKQILLGISHLHSLGLVHRDIRIENILCARRVIVEEPTHVRQVALTFSDNRLLPPRTAGPELTIKISGLSAVAPAAKPLHCRGVKEYTAPEVNKLHGMPADVWSLGCILFEMLTGYIAFPRSEAKLTAFGGLLRQPKRIYEQRQEWTELSQEARSLIHGMLTHNPAKRMTIADCLAHPWIAGADAAHPVSLMYDRSLVRAKKVFQDKARRHANKHAVEKGQLFMQGW